MKYRFILVVALSAVLMACSTPPRSPTPQNPHYETLEQALTDGFSLKQTVKSQTGHVARVHANPQGRRLLVIGSADAEGLGGITGWGFVLPCEACGFDLPAAENLLVSWQGTALHIRDRSVSTEAGIDSDALLVLRFTREKQQWRLARVEQHSTFHKKGTAEKAIIDYDLGYSYDATGRWADGQWVELSSQEAQSPPQYLPIHELNLY